MYVLYIHKQYKCIIKKKDIYTFKRYAPTHRYVDIN